MIKGTPGQILGRQRQLARRGLQGTGWQIYGGKLQRHVQNIRPAGR